MNLSEAENSILFLEMQFGRTFQATARKMLIADILKYSYSAAKKATDKMLSEERMLPAPVIVNRRISEFATLERETEAGKQRSANMRSSNFLDKPQNTKMAAQACQLVRAATAGLSRNKIIEGMMHMQMLYPGIGWANSASELQKFYEDRGLK